MRGRLTGIKLISLQLCARNVCLEKVATAEEFYG